MMVIPWVVKLAPELVIQWVEKLVHRSVIP
jgi:hypothetical protein